MALDSVDPNDVCLIDLRMHEHSFTVRRICGCYSLLVPLVMRETRSSILLTRLAKKIRKETGDHRYRARIEDERASLSTLIFVSCTRPIRRFCVLTLKGIKLKFYLDLLFTEPVVSSFSVIFPPFCLSCSWRCHSCGLDSSGAFCSAELNLYPGCFETSITLIPAKKEQYLYPSCEDDIIIFQMSLTISWIELGLPSASRPIFTKNTYISTF
jgi:hypothetical protein